LTAEGVAEVSVTGPTRRQLGPPSAYLQHELKEEAETERAKVPKPVNCPNRKVPKRVS
jgi:hypothetical protein